MNQIDLAGRRAIITGGAQGIGLATAERFIASGAEVVLWDINAANLDRATDALGGSASGRVVELTDESAVNDAAREAGAIDILVNNAGITGGNGKTWNWRRMSGAARSRSISSPPISPAAHSCQA